MKAEEILYQLAAIATADTTALVQVHDGALEIRSTDQLPKKLRCAIASIEKSTGGIKVKLYDKLKALELLGKYMGLFDGSGSAAGGRSRAGAICIHCPVSDRCHSAQRGIH